MLPCSQKDYGCFSRNACNYILIPSNDSVQLLPLQKRSPAYPTKHVHQVKLLRPLLSLPCPWPTDLAAAQKSLLVTNCPSAFPCSGPSWLRHVHKQEHTVHSALQRCKWLRLQSWRHRPLLELPPGHPARPQATASLRGRQCLHLHTTAHSRTLHVSCGHACLRQGQ